MSLLKVATKNSRLTAEQQAVRWLLRIQQATLDEGERAAFAQWHAEECNREAFHKAERLWRGIDQIATTPPILDLIHKAPSVVPGPWRRVAAALAACCILATLGLWFGKPASGLFTQRDDSAPSEQVFTTAIGQRTTLTLSDGSTLALNTDSAVRVRYTASERAIVLVQGQALFKVAKNPSRPFVVQAADRQIVVTGTAFDVRLDRTTMQVTLVEGNLAVHRMHARDGARQLRAGQQLVATQAGDSITETDVNSVTSWVSGNIVFLDVGLDQAVDEINRYSATPLRLADPSLGALRINGVFRVGMPAEFARAVTEVHPVLVERRADGTVALVRKPG